MNLIVFGATGRVGRAFIGKAVHAGHRVTAFVRNSGGAHLDGVALVQGDVRDISSVRASLAGGFDAVIVCIGEAGLKPSTIVSEGFSAIVAGMTAMRLRRFIGVSGSAEMPQKTWAGKLYTAIVRHTPVGNAVRDHDGGLRVLQTSSLDWTLAGCNYLADGPERGRYRISLIFPGGFKIIHPGDVADFLLQEMTRPRHIREVVGLWY
jgi:putative NADH-flavin reductase